MQPAVLWQVVTMAGLPLAVCSLLTDGQLTVVPKFGPLTTWSSALRNEVKMKGPEVQTAHRDDGRRGQGEPG